MPGTTGKTTAAAAPDQAISQRRRRLLKAAASTAPLVATLQSGAAFATPSAFQCVANAERNPSLPAGIPVVVDDNQYAESCPPANADQYVRTKSSRGTLEDGTVVYLADGSTTWYDANGKPIPEATIDVQDDPVWTLTYYNAKDGYLGATPVATWPQPQSDAFVLGQSCMCSVNAGMVDNALRQFG